MSLPRKLNSFLFSFYKKHVFYLLLIIGGRFSWTLVGVGYAYVSKLFIDQLKFNNPGEQDFATLFYAPLRLLLALFFGGALLYRLSSILKIYTYPKIKRDIRSQLFRYTQQHSHSFFLTHMSGTLGQRIEDLATHAEKIMDILISSFLPVFFSLSLACLIFIKLHPSMIVIVLFFVINILLSTWFWMSSILRTAENYAESVVQLNGRIVDSLSNIFTVRLFAQQKYEDDHFALYLEEEVISSQENRWSMEQFAIWRSLTTNGFVIFIVCIALYHWNGGTMSAGDVSLAMGTASQLAFQFWNLSNSMIELFKSYGKANNALSTLSLPHQIIDTPQAKSLKVERGEIHFDQVSFGYKSKTGIFEKSSFTIQGGEKVGLVGLSGSGKTTLMNLLLRLYEIRGGRICIDGQDIQQVTQESLHQQIAIIPQQPTLFHRTLRENLCYGNLEATDEEVWKAVRLSKCEEFIKKMPSGLQTIVGEQGGKLSGGQRQRIAIARALLKKAPIFIMDEATSALDSITENALQNNLDTLLANRTCVVIAHRLSTLENMDRIILLEKGKIVEEGSVEALIQKKGAFYQLWNQQNTGFLPEEKEENR